MNTLSTSRISEPADPLASEDWQLTEPGHSAMSLLVQQRRFAHVLPYYRFVYAEGDNSEVKLVFSSHVVTVKGQVLGALLVAVAAQRVIRLMQPTENEVRFHVRGVPATGVIGPAIESICVEEAE